MPYREEMTWSEPHKRWQKMHKGVRYRIHVKQLEADRTLPKVMLFTRDGSRAAANAWWERKLADLLGKPSRVETLSRMMSEEDELRQRVAQLEREAFEARRQLQARDDGLNRVLANVVIMHKDGTGEIDVEDIARNPEVDVLEQMTQTGKPASTAPACRTLKAASEQFLAGAKINRKSGRPVAGPTYSELRDFVLGLAKRPPFGPDYDVAGIDAAVAQQVHAGLATSALSDSRKAKFWKFFVRFVTWLHEYELLAALPKNLKNLGFTVGAAKPRAYGIDQVRAVLAGLDRKPRLKLYALLALNTGMLNADIGRLTKKMVDLDAGRLTRKRGKTKGHDNVPEVCYRLWPETVELLRECESDHPTLWLTGMSGEPLWSASVAADGSTPQKDMIVQQWRRANPGLPLDAMRKVAPTALKGHPTHSRYVDHWLGHAPQSIADKHYASEDAAWQADFDEALAWLRTQLLGSKKA